MKKTIIIYELLGLVKDNNDTDIYVKYMNRMTEKEDKMWACKENIINKLDNKIICLNDEVEIFEIIYLKQDEEEFEDIEEISYYPVRKNEIAIDYIENNETKHFCLNKKEKYFADKINQLIKNQKILIEKLKNKE